MPKAASNGRKRGAKRDAPKRMSGNIPKPERVPTKHAGRNPETGVKQRHRPDEVTQMEVAKLAKRGATDIEIAVMLDLRPGQVRLYEKMINQELARKNLEVEEAVHAAALGYSHPDTHIGLWDGVAIKTKTTKHYPPNMAAASFWLRNRASAQWKDEQSRQTPPDEGAAMIRERLKQIDDATGGDK